MSKGATLAALMFATGAAWASTAGLAAYLEREGRVHRSVDGRLVRGVHWHDQGADVEEHVELFLFEPGPAVGGRAGDRHLHALHRVIARQRGDWHVMEVLELEAGLDGRLRKAARGAVRGRRDPHTGEFVELDRLRSYRNELSPDAPSAAAAWALIARQALSGRGRD